MFFFDGWDCVPVLHELFGLRFPAVQVAGSWVGPGLGGETGDLWISNSYSLVKGFSYSSRWSTNLRGSDPISGLWTGVPQAVGCGEKEREKSEEKKEMKNKERGKKKGRTETKGSRSNNP